MFQYSQNVKGYFYKMNEREIEREGEHFNIYSVFSYDQLNKEIHKN